MRNVLLAIVVLTAFLSCNKTNEVNLIPKPVSFKLRDGSFTISGKTKVKVDSTDSLAFENAAYLVELFNSKGVSCALESAINDDLLNCIIFTRTSCPDSLGAEGYMIDVNPKAITIRANQSAGFFYAIQTLRQLMPANFEKMILGQNR